MAGICLAADLESCCRALGHEVDREVAVVDEGYEQVALLFDESCCLAVVWHADPVEVTACDGGLDAGEQEFVLCEFAEVEEVDADFDAVAAPPCKDFLFEAVPLCFLHIDDHIGSLDLRQWLEGCRDGSAIFAYPPSAEEVYYWFKHINSRISFFAAFQRGMSIFVPTTSTTFAAMIEPTSPQTLRGMPSECA